MLSIVSNRLLVDIGGTYIRVAYSSGEEGGLISLIKTRSKSGGGKRSFVEHLRKLIIDAIVVLSDRHITDPHLYIAVPGHVNSYTMTVSFPPAFSELQNFDLIAELSDLFPHEKIVVENDANARAIGEYNYLIRHENQLKNSIMIVITVGTGLGAGIIVDGSITRGFYGLSGEIGYMCVEFGGKMVRARDYCSGSGLVRMAEDLGGDTLAQYLVVQPSERMTAELICQKALDGNDFAILIWDTFTDLLSVIIFNLFCAFDPSVVIIGGGLTVSSIFDFGQLQKKVQEKAIGVMASRKNYRVIPNNLGDEGVLYGLSIIK